MLRISKWFIKNINPRNIELFLYSDQRHALNEGGIILILNIFVNIFKTTVIFIACTYGRTLDVKSPFPSTPNDSSFEALPSYACIGYKCINLYFHLCALNCEQWIYIVKKLRCSHSWRRDQSSINTSLKYSNDWKNILRISNSSLHSYWI